MIRVLDDPKMDHVVRLLFGELPIQPFSVLFSLMFSRSERPISLNGASCNAYIPKSISPTKFSVDFEIQSENIPENFLIALAI